MRTKSDAPWIIARTRRPTQAFGIDVTGTSSSRSSLRRHAGWRSTVRPRDRTVNSDVFSRALTARSMIVIIGGIGRRWGVAASRDPGAIGRSCGLLQGWALVVAALVRSNNVVRCRADSRCVDHLRHAAAARIACRSRTRTVRRISSQ